MIIYNARGFSMVHTTLSERIEKVIIRHLTGVRDSGGKLRRLACSKNHIIRSMYNISHDADVFNSMISEVRTSSVVDTGSWTDDRARIDYKNVS